MWSRFSNACTGVQEETPAKTGPPLPSAAVTAARAEAVVNRSLARVASIEAAVATESFHRDAAELEEVGSELAQIDSNHLRGLRAYAALESSALARTSTATMRAMWDGPVAQQTAALPAPARQFARDQVLLQLMWDSDGGGAAIVECVVCYCESDGPGRDQLGGVSCHNGHVTCAGCFRYGMETACAPGGRAAAVLPCEHPSNGRPSAAGQFPCNLFGLGCAEVPAAPPPPPPPPPPISQATGVVVLPKSNPAVSAGSRAGCRRWQW